MTTFSDFLHINNIIKGMREAYKLYEDSTDGYRRGL